MKQMIVAAVVGLVMFVGGLATLVWGGILLENYSLGFAGSVSALVGMFILTRKA